MLSLSLSLWLLGALVILGGVVVVVAHARAERRAARYHDYTKVLMVEAQRLMTRDDFHEEGWVIEAVRDLQEQIDWRQTVVDDWLDERATVRLWPPSTACLTPAAGEPTVASSGR